MELLKKMEDVIEYIEGHITDSIDYGALASILCCSVYEFSRIFSFVAGVSVSEYVRNRRLSLAVFDIQSSEEKIIDIAMKYCYESNSSFSRAFKAMHGVSPAKAKEQGVKLATYPKLSFSILVKGAVAMNFRIEKKDSFKIMGLKGYSDGVPMEETELDRIWDTFLDNPGDYNRIIRDNGYYTEPMWQVAAYKDEPNPNGSECIIGAELKDKPVLPNMDVETIPAATWAVFTIKSRTGAPVPEAYTRIITEWLPTSSYERDKDKPNMEVFGPGNASSDDYEWEIWLPIIKK